MEVKKRIVLVHASPLAKFQDTHDTSHSVCVLLIDRVIDRVNTCAGHKPLWVADGPVRGGQSGQVNASSTGRCVLPPIASTFYIVCTFNVKSFSSLLAYGPK